MSIKLMAQVWDKAEAEGSKLLLLLALADMANDEGYCWPSHATLAKKIRKSTQTTTRLVADLEEEGWLKKESRYKNNRQTSNLYQVIIPEKLGVSPMIPIPTIIHDTPPPPYHP